MKAIDFTVSEYNSVSIVFFICFIRCSKGADMDDRFDEIINVSGMIVAPGFINTHHHTW